MEDEHYLALDRHMARFRWSFGLGTWTYWLVEVEDDSHMTSTYLSSTGGRICEEIVELWLIYEHFGSVLLIHFSHTCGVGWENISSWFDIFQIDHTLGDRALWWRGFSSSYYIICWLLLMDWGIGGCPSGLFYIIFLLGPLCKHWMEHLKDYFILSHCLEGSH